MPHAIATTAPELGTSTSLGVVALIRSPEPSCPLSPRPSVKTFAAAAGAASPLPLLLRRRHAPRSVPIVARRERASRCAAHILQRRRRRRRRRRHEPLARWNAPDRTADAAATTAARALPPPAAADGGPARRPYGSSASAHGGDEEFWKAKSEGKSEGSAQPAFLPLHWRLGEPPRCCAVQRGLSRAHRA